MDDWRDYSYLLNPPKAGFVYRLLNGDGEVIYVGQSRRSLQGRMRDHAKVQPWWGEVAAVQAKRFPVADLDREEQAEIARWRPAHNVQHNPDTGPKQCNPNAWPSNPNDPAVEWSTRSDRIRAGLAKRQAAGKPLGRQSGAKDARPRKRSGYVAAWEDGGARRRAQES